MSAHELYVEGVGFWATRLPGWDVARDVLRGRAKPPAVAATRPSPSLLPPAERRRAPDTVAVALEVAARACESAGRDPQSLPSVFASANGDLPVSDAICDTLAKTPLLTSPTRFHNSVHNAAAGYWSIATGCMKPYTALCGRDCTFGQGLLESAAQALSEQTPVLFVAYDMESRGPVATMQPSRGAFAVALVMSPEPRVPYVARLTLEVREGVHPRQSAARPGNAALVEGNAMMNALPLFEALADGIERDLSQLLAPALSLQVRVAPAPAAANARAELLQGAL
jgi:Beta-ketoacyl synthase, N-terminal domain